LREAGEISQAKWNIIHKEIEDYRKELDHYRKNLMDNPIVHRGMALDKLAKYRKRTISGLKTIKRHSLYSGSGILLNQIAEDLMVSCDLLLSIIIDELLEKTQNDMIMLENIYDLKEISQADISI